jgi:hypothetical protein
LLSRPFFDETARQTGYSDCWKNDRRGGIKLKKNPQPINILLAARNVELAPQRKEVETAKD